MNQGFNLAGVISVIHERRRMIFGVTLAAALIALAVYLMKPARYHASSEFIISNPLFADRNNMFRVNEIRYIDYFGSDDDLDRVIAIASSNLVSDLVIRDLHLYQSYGLDSTNPKDRDRMNTIWHKSFDIDRTEYKNLIVSYLDTNRDRTVAVVNASIRAIEAQYRGYYDELKNQVYMSLLTKKNQIDSSITSLTDTLSRIRDRYQFYTPARAMMGGASPRGSAPEFGAGLENIQSYEALKDQFVADRSRYVSLLNEFSTATGSNVSFIKIITPAVAPVKPSTVNPVVLVVASALFGLFISTLFALIRKHYQRNEPILQS